jgi:arylsulfatase A-like enzyme
MVELVGAAPLPETQGTSLVPLLRGEERAARPLLIQDCPKAGPLHSALVVGRFKYVRRMRAGADGAAEVASERLFDVVADPGETRNLAGEHEHAATLAQARTALDRLLAEMEATAQRFAARRESGDVGGADLDADLKNLGYGK